MADTLHLTFCVDDCFAPHLAVLFCSIQLHSNPSVQIHCHVVGSLSADVKNKLVSVAGHRSELHFYPDVPDFSHLHISPAFASRLSLATYHRLALPELLPDLTRVIYLDADMLAQADLSALWRTDLQGRAAAVVQDYYLEKQKRWEVLGLTYPEYFNAGMLLMDLTRWRREGIAIRVAEAVTAHPDWEYNDQDGLNMILNGQCLYVDPRWNATTTRIHAGAVDQPALVHFTGQEKPWHVSSVHPYRDVYREYKQQTPWRDEPPTHFLDHEDLRLLETLRHRLPRGGAIAIYGCGARGRRLALFLRDRHLEFEIRYMIDRAAASPFEGIPVHRQPPDTDIDALLIASIPFRDEIFAALPASLIAQSKVL